MFGLAKVERNKGMISDDTNSGHGDNDSNTSLAGKLTRRRSCVPQADFKR